MLAFMSVATLNAATYYVDASRPDDGGDGLTWATAKRAIQAAVDCADDDDVLLVAPGTYWPINTNDKRITIESAGGATVTVIDGGNTNRCATLGRSTDNTVLTGFTLRNGYASHANVTIERYVGGGAYYGTLNNCTITGNTAGWQGGGASYSTLNNCTLSGNAAGSYGGGSYYGTLNSCTLSGNTANYGGGSYYGTLNNCTLSGNTAEWYGGGSSYGMLRNCIVWGNSAFGYANYSGGTFYYSCADPKPSGDGNITADPMFVDAINGNFRLMVGSPCINAGNNDYVTWGHDLNGNPRIRDGTVDMGAYESPPPCLFDPEDAEDTAPLFITTAYDGFLYDTNNTVRGMVTLRATRREKKNKDGTTTTNWTVSAKAVMQTASARFSGIREGALERFIAVAKNGEMLDVTMQGDRFFGTFSGAKADGKLTVDGARAVFADKVKAAQDRLDKFRGLYNVALLETDDYPSLTKGYVSLTVGNLGLVKYAGVLADGTKVSGSGKLLDFLNEDGWLAVALFKPLYLKKGFIGGLLWIDTASKQVLVDSEYGWCVDWVCTDPQKVPFAYALDVLGGRFGDGTTATPPPSGLRFSAFVETDDYPSLPGLTGGRWIEEAFPWELPVTPNGLKPFIVKGAAPKKPKGEAEYDYEAVRDRNPSLATFSYTAKTGVFKGKFNLYYDGYSAKGALAHKAASVSYSGVMVPHAGGLIGLGTGTATINKQKVGVPVFLGN
ncbi:MAG: right-handed parallel beta-helix repeat-containing protein [Kiritimatiellaeota bacterium]|nr:right-handed parallel beta-helix repeat-containing protein [Kiritimatiellota bacterium]